MNLLDPAIALLQKILAEKGFDASAYRPTFLRRLVESRVRSLGLKRIEEYPFYLNVHSEEFHHLLDSLSINVTSFFRDPVTFRVFRYTVIPSLLAGRRAGEKRISIWSAGCASGQEPYSAAMLLWEALGKEQDEWKVRIWATDVNERALLKGKNGRYSEKEMEGVKSRFLEQFFERDGGSYTVKPFLRTWVRFFKHDLLSGKGFVKTDVIFCRNVLIYFEREAQVRVACQLADDLVQDGFLIVGGSEILSREASRLFTPISLSGRVYQKI